MRFELTTPTLARLCSTPELRPLCVPVNGAAIIGQNTCIASLILAAAPRRVTPPVGLFEAVDVKSSVAFGEP
jgi:hypothetical protein